MPAISPSLSLTVHVIGKFCKGTGGAHRAWGGINAPVQISKVQERQESGKNLMNTVLGEGKRKKTPENGITLVFITISVPAQGWRGSVCNAGYTYVGIPVRPNLCVSVR